MEYDIVIVGAGPAGSMAALVLSRAGRRVLVLEKATFPRTKVCGDSLNPNCWPMWEKHGLTQGFNQLPHFDIAGFTLELEGTAMARSTFPDHRARTVERSVLDHWLAREAEKSGARYQFGVTIHTAAGGRVVSSAGEFEAASIIGADGRNSVVGRASGLAQTSKRCSRVAWQSLIHAPSLGDHIHMNVFPEGYYGINRIDAMRASITMVLFSEGKIDPEKIVERYLPGASCESWKSLHPITRRPWRVTNGQTWLVGDAAQILEPLTGEGIYSALATGEMAARHILSMEKIGVERAAANYRREHRRFYGSRTLVNSLVRWILEDSTRSMRILKGLKRWPGLVNLMVDSVQSPEKHPFTLAKDAASGTPTCATPS